MLPLTTNYTLTKKIIFIMIVLGIILMIVGGAIFANGEDGNCLFMIIGAIINFSGIGILISAF